MSQATQEERKDRFQISREVQKELVNNIAETMMRLADKGGQPVKEAAGFPYCPMSGREYSGVNMANLMLTALDKGYADNRWMSFRQLEQFQENHPALNMHIRKGEKGVRVLRPENVTYIVTGDGRKEFLSEEQEKELTAQRQAGQDVPEVRHEVLFYPYTVFNASQIEGFPAKEQLWPAMNEREKSEFVDRLIACSGMQLRYRKEEALPLPSHDMREICISAESYGERSDTFTAQKLDAYFSATGSMDFENRIGEDDMNNVALEQMRSDVFFAMSTASLGMPLQYSEGSDGCAARWKYGCDDLQAVFRGVNDAAKIITLMHQFEQCEQPKAQWFPRREEWPALVEAQKERDQAAQSQIEAWKKQLQTEQTSRDADGIHQVCTLLRSQEFLDTALRQASERVRELATLCDSVSATLNMELDSRQRESEPVPPPEKSAGSRPRMRM